DSIINGMQGERVNSLCFSRSINSWHELSPSSVILRVNRNDYYRVDLIGTCRPENAFSTISIQSRNGMCLAAGDTISFDNDFAADSCSVTNIYHWIPAPVDEIVTN
ncbi:MAG TPA: DUF6491 family protein, partial [Pseudohongiella sp.]|nr:DUF6491 family protein [Pseudohongiella sp.]